MQKNSKWNRRDFIKAAGISGYLGISGLSSSYGAVSTTSKIDFEELSKKGDKFSFAIFADPQVGPADSNARTYVNSRRTQIQSIKEINSFTPQPAFALVLGDLVNVPDDASLSSFEDCIKGAEMPVLLVHGNHEARPPYTLFKETQNRVNGMQETYYSFDIGKWHFIVTPCNLDKATEIETETEEQMLRWLEKDLAQNKDRPTIFFNHLPLMPIGLSQLEWYVFRLELRKKLIELITRHGNVKYFFHGHVHCGIKASVKTSWQYKGTQFINVPTIIEGRNFGEEFEIYEHGLPTGGYYMVVHVDGREVTLEGRLTGVEKGHTYPKSFREFSHDIEPRWFTKAIDLEPAPELLDSHKFTLSCILLRRVFLA